MEAVKRVGVNLTALFIGVSILILDLLSKWLTHHYIPLMHESAYWYPYGGIGIFKDLYGVEFSISHTTNIGAAWGFLSQYQLPLLIFRIALIAALTAYIAFFNKNRTWLIPLTLITVGAAANVIDFFIYGHVIDMFHFVLWGYDFPVFNVADSAICLGIAWLFILSFFE